MNSARQRLVAVATALFLAVLFFLPNLAYLAVRAGVLEFARPAQVLGLNVAVADEWFPVAATDSFLAPILISQRYVPTVLYYKNDWLNPWGSSFLAMSRPANAAVRPISWADFLHGAKIEFPWGTVVEQSVQTGPNAYKVFLLLRYQLSIATHEPGALREITDIAEVI